MPTYEYRCAKCGQHLEVFQSFSETPLSVHEACGGKLAKVLSAAGIVLKGSGFYKNDSRDSSRSKSKKRAEAKTSEAGPSKTADTGSSGTSVPTETAAKTSDGSAA